MCLSLTSFLASIKFRQADFRGKSARVAELVDALDLGSSGFWPWEFESPLSHHKTCACRCDISLILGLVKETAFGKYVLL